MKAHIDDTGNLCVNLNAVIDELTDDQCREFIDGLSCRDSVIKDVTAQLLDGWTERGSHGARSCDPIAEHPGPLSEARLEIASRADEVAVDRIRELESALRWKAASEDRYSKWAYSLLRQLEVQGLHPQPWGPDYISAKDASKYEVVLKAGANKALEDAE